MIQPERCQISRSKTLDDHVRLARQTPEDLSTLGLCQIKGDAALVEIGQQEEQAFFRMRIVLMERRHAPAAVSTRRLKLDDIGSVITHQPRTERTRYPLAKIQHQQVVEYRPAAPSFLPLCRQATMRGYIVRG